jgi:hypothetical protein
MPEARCRNCGYLTNSAVSNYCHTDDCVPTECYARWCGDKWIEGCSIDKADPFLKRFSKNLISEK